MAKFKVGDTIRRLSDGAIDRVTALPGDHEYDQIPYIDAELGMRTERRGCEYQRDWELTMEGGAQVARRTFKSIQSGPVFNKGALLQQSYEGSDRYEYINAEEFARHTLIGGRHIMSASAVENEPRWFVEVFQVEPQYMTREELDQWEAFKSSKPATTKRTAPKASVAAAKKLTGTTTYWTPAKRKAQSAKLKAYWAAKKAAS